MSIQSVQGQIKRVEGILDDIQESLKSLERAPAEDVAAQKAPMRQKANTARELLGSISNDIYRL